MFDGREPIYVQTAQQVRDEVLTGVLGEEEPVMSTTQCATPCRVRDRPVAFPPAMVSCAAGTVSGLLGGLHGTAVLPGALAPILFLTVRGVDDGTSRSALVDGDRRPVRQAAT